MSSSTLTKFINKKRYKKKKINENHVINPENSKIHPLGHYVRWQNMILGKKKKD